MPNLLDLVYLLVVVAASPMLVYRSWRRGKYREGWRQKLLGKAPRRLSERPCVWFHAVSVGEVMLLRPLVASLARRHPDWDIFISATTPTGLAVARRNFPEHVTFFAPLDFTWATRQAVRRIRPSLLVLVELELWPNLIKATRDAGGRVMVANGRLSEHSFRGYRKVRALLGPTLNRLDAVAAQTPDYAQRFRTLGVPGNRVSVTGSIKYDGLEANRDNARTRALRKDLGLASTELIFVAGSTMAGEEAAALKAYREAKARHPQLRLVIVPRHTERFSEVAAWLEAQGETVLRRSQGPAGPVRDRNSVVLIDTLGELGAVWGLADVAFVGGSLYPGRGGQNMMEPAAYGAAVLFGPHTENFRDAVEGLLACDGARRVADDAELTAALGDALDSPEDAEIRGEAGRAFVLAQQGATDATVAVVEGLVARPAGPHFDRMMTASRAEAQHSGR